MRRTAPAVVIERMFIFIAQPTAALMPRPLGADVPGSQERGKSFYESKYAGQAGTIF
jgi:hypothetical protein